MDRDISEEVKVLRSKLRLGGLILKQGHGDGWDWSAARAHVCGHGHALAAVFVNVLGS